MTRLPASRFSNFFLLQQTGDRVELGVELGADGVERDENDNRNAGRHKAILNRGSARLVLEEGDNPGHGILPLARRTYRRLIKKRESSARIRVLAFTFCQP